jgi:hypothetical protein
MRRKLMFSFEQTRTIPTFRRMEEKDVNDVQRLLDVFLRRYDIAPVFNAEEVKHWFLPIEGVIESFVVEVSFGCLLGIVRLQPTDLLSSRTRKNLDISRISFHSTPFLHLLSTIRNTDGSRLPIFSIMAAKPF